MKNLDSFGVQELSALERVQVDGGRFKKLWKLTKKYGGWALDAAGVYDAVDDFSEGFSEGNC